MAKTAKMKHIEQIEKIVRDTLDGHFDNIRILEVKVRRDIDAEGDGVLKIDVIFKGSPRDLDITKLSGTVRHLRPKLLEKVQESAFPLLSFISKSDYDARASR